MTSHNQSFQSPTPKSAASYPFTESKVLASFSPRRSPQSLTRERRLRQVLPQAVASKPVDNAQNSTMDTDSDPFSRFLMAVNNRGERRFKATSFCELVDNEQNFATDIESDPFSPRRTATNQIEEDSSALTSTPTSAESDSAHSPTNEEEEETECKKSNKRSVVKSDMVLRKRARTSYLTSPQRAKKAKLEDQVLILTSRNEIRETIASETRAKENNFLLHNRHFFMPLLPESNYITKLLETPQGQSLSGEEIAYQEVNCQPEGSVIPFALYFSSQLLMKKALPLS